MAVAVSGRDEVLLRIKISRMHVVDGGVGEWERSRSWRRALEF